MFQPAPFLALRDTIVRLKVLRGCTFESRLCQSRCSRLSASRTSPCGSRTQLSGRRRRCASPMQRLRSLASRGAGSSTARTATPSPRSSAWASTAPSAARTRQGSERACTLPEMLPTQAPRSTHNLIERDFSTWYLCPQTTSVGVLLLCSSFAPPALLHQPHTARHRSQFLCRVTVGEFCLGKNDAPAPDVRKGHQLYDSTVNDMKHPSIFVAYHDAQAYPEYLVKFSQ